MSVDTLLHPIAPDAPCGVDLSFSLEFDAILEKRREDDPTLDQGAWVRALKVADWGGVAADCETLLVGRTKDLRVVGWLTDAYARIRGFAGLADGLEVCERLCASYWDGLHPQADDGDFEQRAGSLNWLLAQVPELSRRAPVIGSGSRRYTLRDIDAARNLQQAMARSGADPSAAAPGGSLTMDELARVQAATPREFFAANLHDLRRAAEALAKLQAVVDAHMGDDGPGFGGARKAIDEALGSVERFARGDGGTGSGIDIPAAGAELGSGAAAALHPDAGGGSGGPLQTRAQALRQLRTVAEFFRRTEPHSPVAYLADKAAVWGDMPLHAWLRVVLKDPSALAHVEELLGVEPPADRS